MNTNKPSKIFNFDNSYANKLKDFCTRCAPEKTPKPELVYFNQTLAEALALDSQANDNAGLADIFSGNCLPTGAEPIAQAYAGHQFGYFNPQLGDGRALVIGEHITPQNKRYDIALKGSGRTPFARGGDGKAALGPMLREVLIAESMHALGIPTTRSLAVVSTGEWVMRESALPGAVLTRVASSHLRIGTFEFFAAKGQHHHIQQLADYTIERHFPELLHGNKPYLDMLEHICDRQARLIAQWMGLGFIHGVMNTDNTSLAGETIDYGPCAFMEAYQPNTVFSAIDQQGRYAYQNQPTIAQWNLARLAEAILSLLDDNKQTAIELASTVLDDFPSRYEHYWLQTMRGKLGLSHPKADDKTLIEEWLTLLQTHSIDFTLAWRGLSDASENKTTTLQQLFTDKEALFSWLEKWRARCDQDKLDHQARASLMRNMNPWIIPRNHWVEHALTAASDHLDLKPFNTMMAALQQPYEDKQNPEFAQFSEPAPRHYTQHYQTFCGT